jgi:hypothetical protein
MATSEAKTRAVHSATLVALAVPDWVVSSELMARDGDGRRRWWGRTRAGASPATAWKKCESAPQSEQPALSLRSPLKRSTVPWWTLSHARLNAVQLLAVRTDFQFTPQREVSYRRIGYPP